MSNPIIVTEIAPFDNETTKIALAAIYEMYRAAGSPPDYLSITFGVFGVDYTVWMAPENGKTYNQVIKELKREIAQLKQNVIIGYGRLIHGCGNKTREQIAWQLQSRGITFQQIDAGDDVFFLFDFSEIGKLPVDEDGPYLPANDDSGYIIYPVKQSDLDLKGISNANSSAN
jgi:hypothetical protein